MELDKVGKKYEEARQNYEKGTLSADLVHELLAFDLKMKKKRGRKKGKKNSEKKNNNNNNNNNMKKKGEQSSGDDSEIDDTPDVSSDEDKMDVDDDNPKKEVAEISLNASLLLHTDEKEKERIKWIQSGSRIIYAVRRFRRKENEKEKTIASKSKEEKPIITTTPHAALNAAVSLLRNAKEKDTIVIIIDAITKATSTGGKKPADAQYNKVYTSGGGDEDDSLKPGDIATIESQLMKPGLFYGEHSFLIKEKPSGKKAFITGFALVDRFYLTNRLLAGEFGGAEGTYANLLRRLREGIFAKIPDDERFLDGLYDLDKQSYNLRGKGMMSEKPFDERVSLRGLPLERIVRDNDPIIQAIFGLTDDVAAFLKDVESVPEEFRETQPMEYKTLVECKEAIRMVWKQNRTNNQIKELSLLVYNLQLLFFHLQTEMPNREKSNLRPILKKLKNVAENKAIKKFLKKVSQGNIGFPSRSSPLEIIAERINASNVPTWDPEEFSDESQPEHLTGMARSRDPYIALASELSEASMLSTRYDSLANFNEELAKLHEKIEKDAKVKEAIEEYITSPIAADDLRLSEAQKVEKTNLIHRLKSVLELDKDISYFAVLEALNSERMLYLLGAVTAATGCHSYATISSTPTTAFNTLTNVKRWEKRLSKFRVCASAQELAKPLRHPGFIIPTAAESRRPNELFGPPSQTAQNNIRLQRHGNRIYSVVQMDDAGSEGQLIKLLAAFEPFRGTDLYQPRNEAAKEDYNNKMAYEVTAAASALGRALATAFAIRRDSFRQIPVRPVQCLLSTAVIMSSAFCTGFFERFYNQDALSAKMRAKKVSDDSFVTTPVQLKFMNDLTDVEGILSPMDDFFLVASEPTENAVPYMDDEEDNLLLEGVYLHPTKRPSSFLSFGPRRYAIRSSYTFDDLKQSFESNPYGTIQQTAMLNDPSRFMDDILQQMEESSSGRRVAQQPTALRR